MEVRMEPVWRAVLLAIALLTLGARPAAAQESTQAGLVIVNGSHAPTSYCVDLAPDEVISGDELLARAGVRVVAEQSAMGATICSLDGTGCAFPADSCFCQCQGSPCTYWSYWRQNEAGLWEYATAGAGNTRVRAGVVEGWVWGEGSTDSAQSPPVMSLGEICQAPAAQAAALPPAPPAAGTDALPAETIAQDEVGGSAPAAALAEANQPAPSSGPWALVGLAALVAVPVAALLLLRRWKDDA